MQRRSARLAALGALLAAASCTREAEVPHPVIDEGDVECRLGLAGVAEDDRWSLFRVRVRNRGADFRGEMVVRGVSAATEDAVSYRMALEIPGGSSAWREYSFPVKPEGWSELHTTLRGHDFGKTFSTDVPLTEARAFRVLMIGEASVDLSALKSYVAGALKELRG